NGSRGLPHGNNQRKTRRSDHGHLSRQMGRTDQGPDFRSRPSVASAFLTSDCEIPNCRAIAEGLTPALKAARTAFSLPVVNEPAPSSARAWRGCGFASAVGFSFAGFS